MRRKLNILFIGIFVALLTISVEARTTRIIVNGEDITNEAQAINKNDRLLVPIRFISEALGKEVSYIDYSKEVKVTDLEGTLTLKINSNLIELQDGSFYLSDVPAIIENDRTYVPVRIIAESFKLGVNYDEKANLVTIGESDVNPDDSYMVEGFSDVLTEPQEFKVVAGANVEPRIKTNKLYVLDSITKKGFVSDIKEEDTVKYIPWQPKDFKILMVASYDDKGKLVAGRGRKVQIELIPNIKIDGVMEGENIVGHATLTPNINFLAKSVSFTVTDLDTNETAKFEDKDPYDAWYFAVPGGESKRVKVVMNAIDIDNNIYLSNPVSFSIETPRSFNLVGVKPNQSIDKTITLNVSRNFDVTKTRYFISKDGEEKLLIEKDYGSYILNPSEDMNGEYLLRAEVDLPNGETLTTEPIAVNIKGGKRLLLQGVGPDAVISSEIDLQYDSNVKVDSIKYVFKGADSFTIDGVVGGQTKFDPKGKKDGQYTLSAIVKYGENTLSSEEIKVKIHNGKVFGPRAVVEKSEFINTFSKLAVESMNKTGMASSIQLAQAILETGWGQSVPVDKYSGKLSKNLFGIKGVGTNGSILSNTWEEYNGVKYRIDDNFRAYNSVNESWNDHKKLLLEKERYQIFRDVMFDPIRGAWAIRRAGYATDSAYPGKLINLINSQNLRQFDEVGF